ncbi:uncharacterized protein BDZ83DRAFT_376262 [Colletotrichum acutatum]|uniref:Uncharacterized protein n=1 Tax=Glomerella acutata TaxID=27357 RepID=A0AAD9D284_GLOAC|nr:uncharacterized protein BDZ83DRAFT_376262 [Colletotrichum acutatum]KAK1730599.1 hypothetical protein BDZ83DRAFT_376262 [Colletotrichum acutatum]
MRQKKKRGGVGSVCKMCFARLAEESSAPTSLSQISAVRSTSPYTKVRYPPLCSPFRSCRSQAPSKQPRGRWMDGWMPSV